MNSSRLILDSSLTRGGGSHMIMLGGGNAIYHRGLVDSGGKRRPFFIGPDDYFDEEYYDEQGPEKKRRMTPEQVEMLEKSFEADNKLEAERKSELARKLGLQPRQIAIWFQNRKARSKNKQLETDYDRLKASYDSLFSDHESILKDNNQLRSQVFLLTKKLQEKDPSGPGKAEVKLNDQMNSTAGLTPLTAQKKSEDGLSSGSAVFDGERVQKALTGYGESYFLEEYNRISPVQSEGDVSDEGCSHYLEPIFVADYHQSEVDVQPNWWDWS